MSIDIREMTTIYSPFEASRMKVIKLDNDIAYITISDEDSTSAMKFNRAGLLELQSAINQLLEIKGKCPIMRQL